ncbi:hypothetical protein F5148DRAFT_1147471 [Russula earlei]|uniref:Uncharacterized protein n=1 Tax=Russula earlei TaxID=71964 RepID=A0ACC0UFP9_9AGAM|nr:hypothetical protein F5148DRAFT_1147471 [Russula earlei]
MFDSMTPHKRGPGEVKAGAVVAHHQSVSTAPQHYDIFLLILVAFTDGKPRVGPAKMRTSTVFTIICLAVGVVPSFALPVETTPPTTAKRSNSGNRGVPKRGRLHDEARPAKRARPGPGLTSGGVEPIRPTYGNDWKAMSDEERAAAIREASQGHDFEDIPTLPWKGG